MKPQEAWGVLFLAIALLTSQYGTVCVLMSDSARSTGRWVAYVSWCLSCPHPIAPIRCGEPDTSAEFVALRFARGSSSS